ADPRPNYPAVDVSCSVLTRPSLPDLPHTFSFSHATATTEIYTLSLHDALPISSAEATRHRTQGSFHGFPGKPVKEDRRRATDSRDRKSTRLNSSHVSISYAVFCLKKKIH